MLRTGRPARHTPRTLRPALALAPLAILVLAAALAVPPAAAQAPVESTICAVQATGGPSPLEGQIAVVTGVVTADLIRTPTGGFFLEHPGCDGDQATSDGVLVFTFSNTEVEVDVGETAVVTGTVEEYYGMTQLKVDGSGGLGVTVTGQRAPLSPTLLDPPSEVPAALDYFEAREGMFVRMPRTRVVGATNAYGEPYVVPADSGIERIWRGREDGRRVGLLFPLGWQVVNHGDEVLDVVGALNYTFSNYKISVSQPVQVASSGRQPSQAGPSEADELTIASYNVENLFDTVDTPGHDDAGSTPSEEEYPLDIARRARSIVHFLGAPDLVAVQEVESQLALRDLSEHELMAAHGYDSVLVEGPDVRGIDVGYLWKRERLRLLEARSAQACLVERPWSGGPEERCALEGGGQGWMLFSRPPLIGRFAVLGRDAQLTFIVNHFKSKGGGDMETTPERVAMAEHVLHLLRLEKAARPDVPVIVLGDLNDFPDRPPLERLLADGALVDLHEHAGGRQYTYIFNGVSQILDYILVEPELLDEVRDFAPLHVNADFGAPPPGEADHPSPRASDHEPLILRLELPGQEQHRVHLPIGLNGMLDDTGGAPPEPTVPAEPTGQPGEPTAPPVASPTAAAPSPEPTVAGVPRSPLRIVDLRYDGDVPRTEDDEYIEIQNVTQEAVTLTGWSIRSVQGPTPNDQRFVFPSGASLAPGHRCRVYTNEEHPELDCGYSWGYTRSAIWRNSGDKAELSDPDGTLIDHYCYGSMSAECGPS